jgi:hypothetical protein
MSAHVSLVRNFLPLSLSDFRIAMAIDYNYTVVKGRTEGSYLDYLDSATQSGGKLECGVKPWGHRMTRHADASKILDSGPPRLVLAYFSKCMGSV